VRRLVVAVVVVAIFATGLIVTFPAGPLVAALLARLPPDVAAAVERVGSSRLGLRGLTLEDVTLRLRADAPALEIRSLSLRPSLLGFLRGRWGRPWHVEARACAGTASADFDLADDGTVDVTFSGIDLVACLAPFALRDSVAGRATGRARLVVTPAARMWTGVLDLTDARWQARNVPSHLALRADRASLRWRLDDVLHLEELTLANDEFTASGGGTLRFAPSPAAPELDLRVRIEPRAGMPQAHRDLLSRLPSSPPDQAGARTYRLVGPLDALRPATP
jgi:type II secretion system protein N